MSAEDMNVEKISNEDWKRKLTREQYEVCRNKGTETPFSGEYCNSKDKGITNVYAVVLNYSIQRRSLILALVGQVFMLQSIETT
jgi:SelR domain-containing protein